MNDIVRVRITQVGVLARSGIADVGWFHVGDRGLGWLMVEIAGGLVVIEDHLVFVDYRYSAFSWFSWILYGRSRVSLRYAAFTMLKRAELD